MVIRDNGGGGASSGGESGAHGGENGGVWGVLIVDGDGLVGSAFARVVIHITGFLF